MSTSFFQVSLGGALGDGTSSTIDIPDFDLNVWWELKDDVLKYITFVQEEDSTFYKTKVKEPEKNKDLFQKLLSHMLLIFQPMAT